MLSLADVGVTVMASEEDAVEAFGLLDRLLLSEEGRDCLTDDLVASMNADSGDVTFTAQSTVTPSPSADVLVRIDVSADNGVSFVMELSASRRGSIVVLGAFAGFGEPADAELRDALLSAATPAA